MSDKNKEIKRKVRKRYSKIASTSSCCCNCGCGTSVENILKSSKDIGYTNEELQNVPESNLGLGCGNPTAFGNIKEGDTVLDLGSGAGFDSFLALKKVGPTGKVIGLDMTEEMVEKATILSRENKFSNVEFRVGDIENIPLGDNTVDVIISNCVINLTPDKAKVFREAYRVLKMGGKMYVSDIVLLGQLTEEQLKDEDLLTSCVAGALLKEDYLTKIRQAGFTVNILGEDKDLSKKQYGGLPIESLKIEALK